MKEKIFFFLILLISFSNALNDYTSTITFSNSGPSSSGDGVTISGTIFKKRGIGHHLLKEEVSDFVDTVKTTTHCFTTMECTS